MDRNRSRTLRRLVLIPALGLLLGGCATVKHHDPQDPFEGFNRAVYTFNNDFDRALLKPVAKGYKKVVPTPARHGVTNFFSNLNDVVVIANDLLQLKLSQACSDAGRVTFNSTFGLLGFIDVATPLGLPKHNEDLGQTLGYWGVGPGPYLVLPFLGPSTVRDTVGLVGDWQIDPVDQAHDRTVRYSAIALRAVDTRANLLGATDLLQMAAIDPYTFTREAYLQHRRSLVYDGNPPRQGPDDDSGPPPPLPPN